MKKYFCQSPDGTDFFETEKEALEYATKIIESCLDGGEWCEEVEDIICGIVTHKTVMTDKVMKPDNIDEEGCDGEGNWWDSDCDFKCNYEIKRIEDEQPELLKKDQRFICLKCGSEDVVVRPFFGSVSVCKTCGNEWNNPK
jgi:hypothetical protein